MNYRNLYQLVIFVGKDVIRCRLDKRLNEGTYSERTFIDGLRKREKKDDFEE